MARFRVVTHQDGSPYGHRFECPGCELPHVIPTTGPQAWQFNGDVDSPTLSPSVLVHETPVSPRCHSFVRDGRIEFLGDSSHKLAGQTVELPDITLRSHDYET